MKKFLCLFLVNNILCTIYEKELIITKSETEDNFKHSYYVKVYDKLGQNLFEIVNDHSIEDIALSNTNKYLAIADKNGKIMFSNLISKVTMYTPYRRLNTTKIIFNKDDSWLIIASLNRIIVICIKSFDILYEFDCLDTVKLMAIDENNNYLATVSDFNKVKVWDISTGICHLDLKTQYFNKIQNINIIVIDNKPIIKICTNNGMFFCLLTGEQLVLDDQIYICPEKNSPLEIKDYGDYVIKIWKSEYLNMLKKLSRNY